MREKTRKKGKTKKETKLEEEASSEEKAEIETARERKEEGKEKSLEQSILQQDEEKRDKQLKYIIAGMVVLIAAIIVAFLIVDGMKRFEYNWIEFEKIKYGELTFYYSQNLVKNSIGGLVTYNLYLRNDPRKLENILVDEAIRLKLKVILSVDPSIEGCEDNGIAGATLGTLFSVMGVVMTHASTNESFADAREIMHATCDDAGEQSVIIIRQTNETAIRKEAEDCYSINFRDCEVMKAIERFVVAGLVQSKGRATVS